MNIVMAMNMGADDFIAKPFDQSVLIAKVSALLRRAYDFNKASFTLEAAGAVLNTNNNTLSYNGQEVDLAKNEYRILLILMQNKNKVVSLAENVKNPVTGETVSFDNLAKGGLANARFFLTEGGTLGDLYSRSDLVRDNQGNIYVDENGNIATRTLTKFEDMIKLGSVLPKANMAWRNDFKLGRFNASALITARLGGIVYSNTQAKLDWYGVSANSADARDAGGVVINGSDMIDANKWYTTIAGTDTVPQFYTYSATNVRLQEVSLGYTFPRKALGNVCDITLQLVGRNLLMIYCKAPFDPEAVASTTNNFYQGLDYFMTPNTRNFGFNVRINF
jgi:hypothetical protein